MRVDKFVFVAQGPAVLVEYIKKPDTELQFRYKFEIRQIEVATQAELQVNIERLGKDVFLLLARKIVHGVYSGQKVRAVVVEARGGEFYIHRNGNISRLHGLRSFPLRGLLAEHYTLLPEVQRRRCAQRKILVQPPFAQHSHRKTDIHAAVFGIPLLAGGRFDVTIILERYTLRMHTEQKAVMELTVIDIGFVLHRPPLRIGCGSECKSQCKEQYRQLAHFVAVLYFFITPPTTYYCMGMTDV